MVSWVTVGNDARLAEHFALTSAFSVATFMYFAAELLL